jgi:hypothetical protein
MSSTIPDYEDYTGTDEDANPFVQGAEGTEGTEQSENGTSEQTADTEAGAQSEPAPTVQPKVLGPVADPALGLTKGDLPEGYVTIAEFAREIGERGLQKNKQGEIVTADEMKSQTVQAAMKSAPKDDPFPLYVVEDSYGSQRRAVNLSKGVEWWGRRNERIEQRHKNAEEKRLKALEREANLAENFTKTLARAGKALERARGLRQRLLTKAGETDGLDVMELDSVPGVAGTIAFSEPLPVRDASSEGASESEDSAQE